MGTVYPPFQQPVHPLDDGNQPYDPNMQLMAQDPSGMNLYGTLSQGPWEQWLSPENAAFAEAANMAAPNAYAQQNQQQYPQYADNQDSSTQWPSPSTSMHSCPVPSPSTESTSVENATGDSESRRSSSSTQPDKRKRNGSRSTASKAPRRASTRKTTKIEAVSEKPKGRGKGKAVAKSQPTNTPSPEPEEQLDEYSRKVQERNRVASNKFRIKKREDAKKLRADEQDMERANRDLSSCVSDLTMQVYDLKMRLLQHTDCECQLIQEYIASEAHRYIQDLGEGKQNHATPPICPFPQHN
ncbi:Transcription factor atf21 [Fusarium oxysporum f. sp. cubense]|uniref:Transcription factor atf21 n=1 Tax=Fusarium oxysporum f. sp. cubense TaxID=61366 RepID=A0A559LP89_FUSOC|nr:Transcription factor atf21 [Fusarium oxysporum f. sp. cubense]